MLEDVLIDSNILLNEQVKTWEESIQRVSEPLINERGDRAKVCHGDDRLSKGVWSVYRNREVHRFGPRAAGRRGQPLRRECCYDQ
jgi:hypothetical protein